MEPNNIQAALDAGVGLAAIEGRISEQLGLPVALVPNSMKLEVMERAIVVSDARADAPKRLRGTATLTELASFVAHVNRHKDAYSVVFADTAAVKLTAVLNYNLGKNPIDPSAPATVGSYTAPANPARWSDHRAVYACPLSEAWKRWTAASGEEFSQDDFAQFIEDHMDDLASPVGNGDDKDLPSPSEVLTMARKLVINSIGTFSRTVDPVTGNSSLVCKNENDTSSTKIPRAFLLQLQVFEAGAFYRVEARMRMKMAGRPIFSFLLYRAEEIKRDAFDEVRLMVEQKTGLPLFAGSPEA